MKRYPVLLASLLLAAPLVALDLDFNDLPAGDLAGKQGGTNPWQLTNGGINLIEVVTGAGADGTADNVITGLRTGGGSNFVYYTLEVADEDIGVAFDPASTVLTVAFDLMYEGATSGTGSHILNIKIGEAAVLALNDVGRVLSWNDRTLSTNLQPGTWNAFVLTLDFANSTYAAFVNGVPAAENIPFAAATTTAPLKFELRNLSGASITNSSWKINNISIKPFAAPPPPPEEQTLFRIDFNDYALGDLGGQGTETGMRWAQTNGSVNLLEVVADIGPDGAGDNALRGMRTGAGSNYVFYEYQGLREALGDKFDGDAAVVSYSFDFFFEGTPGFSGSHIANIKIGDALLIVVNEAGEIISWPQREARMWLLPNEWNQIQGFIDYGRKTYSLRLNGEQISSSVNFSEAGGSRIGLELRNLFGGEITANSWAIDNIQLEVFPPQDGAIQQDPIFLALNAASFSAKTGARADDWVVVNDEETFGGQYLAFHGDAAGPDEAVLTYRIIISDPGDYNLYVRASGDAGSSILLPAAPDAVPSVSMSFSPGDTFGWAAVDAGAPAGPGIVAGELSLVYTFAEPGVYELKIAAGGAGVRIDAFVLSRAHELVGRDLNALLNLQVGWTPIPITGANIDESIISVVYHVDQNHPDANDANNGLSEAEPLLTLTEAWNRTLQNIAAGVATKIVLHPGVYYEALGEFRATAPAERDTLVIIEGTSRGAVIVSGAETIPAEMWTDEGDGIFSIEWTENRGFLPQPWWNDFGQLVPAISMRTEVLSAGDRLLDQVLIEPHEWVDTDGPGGTDPGGWVYQPELWRGPGVLEDWQYGVSEIEEDKLFVRLPAGVTPADVELRLAALDDFLVLRARGNLVFRNVVVQDFSNRGLTVLGNINNRAANVLVEDSEFYRVGSGLSVNWTDNVTIRRVIAHDCGTNGMSGSGMINAIIEDNDTSYNNWRGGLGGWIGWSVAGMKTLQNRAVRVSRHQTIGNQAHGFWFDYNNQQIEVDQLYAVRNANTGFYWEKNPGPLMMTDSVLMRNSVAGLYLAESPDASFDNLITVGNGTTEVIVRGHAPFRPIVDNAHGNPTVIGISRDTVISNSTFVAGLSRLIFNKISYSDSDYLATFVQTFTGSNNTYFSPFGRNSFFLGTFQPFENWLEAVPEGSEADSRWADPGINVFLSGTLQVEYFPLVDGAPGLAGAYASEAFLSGRPATTALRAQADSFRNYRDNYGLRIRGEIVPPETGVYTFHLASAGESVMVLTNMDRGRLSVSEVVAERYTSSGFRDFTAPGGVPGSVTLQRGQRYTFEVHYRAGEGEDHVSIGWQRPEDNSITVLGAPFIDSPTADFEPAPGYFFADMPGISAEPALYQSETFGWFHAAHFPWLYQSKLGWLYYVYLPTDVDGAWFYSMEHGWVWILKDAPYAYYSGSQTWSSIIN